MLHVIHMSDFLPSSSALSGLKGLIINLDCRATSEMLLQCGAVVLVFSVISTAAALQFLLVGLRYY